jgi:hypothetical protein
VQAPRSTSALLQHLINSELLAGVPVERDYPQLEGCLLLAFTEHNTRDQIDALVEALANA